MMGIWNREGRMAEKREVMGVPVRSAITEYVVVRMILEE